MKLVKKEQLLSLFFIIVICLMGIFAKVRNVAADPEGTLLVSQSILQRGTIKLDVYEEIAPKYFYKIYKKEGHFYYYFPLGTSIFMLPFVAMANALHLDMVFYEPLLQAMTATLISIISYLALAQIAKLYLPPLTSHIVAIIFWGGTAFASTGSTALWSHDLATLFALISIYLLFSNKNTAEKLNPFIIGFCLFSAYFCRPTLALLTPVYLIAVAMLNFRQALKIAATVSVLLGVFVAFSMLEFGQMLPDYYVPQRLSSDHFWLAFYGNLLSPARGLLVYSSFIVLPIIWVIASIKSWPRFRLELILLIWPILHLITISRFPHWWAGFSFGARLMMDALPALFILLLCFLSCEKSIKTPRWIAFFSLGLLSVWINSYQGIFNLSTAIWNSTPSIDAYPEYLFDWKYPQFLSSKKVIKQRLEEHTAKYGPILPG